MLESSTSPAKFPAISKRLLDALDERFPSRPPDLTDSERQVWYKAGARSVVEFLKIQFQDQNEVK